MSQDSSAPRLGLRRWLAAHAVILFGVFLLGFGVFAVVAQKLDNRFAEMAREDHLDVVFKVHASFLPAYAIVALVHGLLSWPIARRRLVRKGRRPRFLRLLWSAFLWTLLLFALSLGPMSFVGPGSLDNLARVVARHVSTDVDVYVFKSWHVQEGFTTVVVILFLLLLWDLVRGIGAWVLRAGALGRTAVGLVLGAAVGLLTLATLSAMEEGAHQEVSTPHIIIVASDSLRWDHLSAHGYERQTSPHIDSLITESIDFNQMHVATASTLESWTSFLTGQYPANHGLRYMFASKEQAQRVAENPHTLPRVLRDRGYESAVVGDWAANCFTLTDFGFDHTETSDIQNLDVFLAEVAFQTHVLIPHYFSHRLGEAVVPLMRQATGFMHPGQLTTRLLDRLDDASSRKKPFFGVLFLASTHLPFKVSYPWNQKFTDPAYRGKNKYEVAFDVDDFIQDGFDQIVPQEEKEQIIALYDGGVAQFDHEVGRIRRHLRESGLENNTILIVTSDHGEDLYEPGTTLGHGTNFFGGDQSTRIPFVVRLPGAELAGRKVEAITRNIDLAPTVLDLVDAAQRTQREKPPVMDGKSLKDLMTGAKEDLGLAAFAETCYLFYPKRVPGEDVYKMKPADQTLVIDRNFRNLFVLNSKYHDYVIETKDRMMRTNRWKLIHIKGKRGPIWRFYDMLNDPDQEADLSQLDIKYAPFEEMKSALLDWKETGRDIPWPKENDWREFRESGK